MTRAESSASALFAVVCLAAFGLFAAWGNAAGADPGCDVRLHPGGDTHDAIAEASAAARICFGAGTYRLHRPLLPHAGQILDGQGHATLQGSRRLRNFHRKGRFWAVPGQVQRGQRSGECRPSADGACRFPDAVYRDGHPLRRVLSRGRLEHGSFYFDYRHHRIFVADSPRGYDLEAATAEAAIVARPGPAGRAVEIRGLRVMMFATPAQHGAIVASSSDWTIEHNRVLLNHGAGISIEQPVTITDNRISRNGQEGIAAAGSRITVTGNVISHNGWAGFDPGWEAGGAKWGEVGHLLVSGNRVTGNKGPGLWDDIGSWDVTYSENVVSGNDGPGIFHEIGGRARILCNRVTHNGFAKPEWLWGSGVLLAASHHVEVAGNTVQDNADGIGLIQQDRGNDPRGRRRYLHDIDVHDNTVALANGDTGLVQDTGDDSVFRDPSITYESNRYEQSRGKRFLWDDTELNAAGWRAVGHDMDGKFLP
jgi:parallel beta-helix repeat protein